MARAGTATLAAVASRIGRAVLTDETIAAAALEAALVSKSQIE